MSFPLLTFAHQNQIIMAKSKQKVEEPPKRRSKQKYPKEYLLKVADRLFSTRPTLKVIENTFIALWGDGWQTGYVRRIEDNSAFQSMRDRRRRHSFEMAIQNIENLIHGGVTKPVEK